MEAEKHVQALLREAIAQGLLRSAHDISDGGVAVALAECCLAAAARASVDLAGPVRPRISSGNGAASVVTVSQAEKNRCVPCGIKHGLSDGGSVGGDSLR